MKQHALSHRPLPLSLRRSTLVLGAALAATLLASCTRSSHHHGGGHGSSPQPDVFVEIEPNDSPNFPDFVAVLDRYSWLEVEGDVQAVGFDIVDHIEFEAAEPMELDFTLTAFGAFGDVDVTIYDPIDNVVLGTYATSGSTEFGTIVVHEAGRPFQFVIEAFDTDSPWVLEIEGFPHSCNCFPRLAGGAADEAQLAPAAEEKPAPIVLKRIPGEVRSRDEQMPNDAI